MKAYGLPYKGSKNRIVTQLRAQIPSAAHFYDLFMGGGAVVHAALLSHRWQHVHGNDINPMMPQMFADAVNGKFLADYHWCSNATFHATKQTDAFNAVVYSFGNNLQTYLYNPELEQYKKAFHNAVANRDYLPLTKYGNLTLNWAFEEDLPTRLIMAQRAAKESKDPMIRRLIHCETLQRIIRINNLNKTLGNGEAERMKLTSLDYTDVKIEDGSVVYCDIPYGGTSAYNKRKFDYDRFFDWCGSVDFPVFISSYELPPDKFTAIWETKLNSTMYKYRVKPRIERLFVPNRQLKQHPRLFLL